MIACRRLGDADYDDLAATLAGAALPISDLRHSRCKFWALVDGGETVGYGGVEGDGADCLLRSVVVATRHRRVGLGKAALASLEAEARGLGVRRLHLLTTDAGGFFAACGYSLADRNAAPSAINRTAQFASICPATASYFVKDITPS